jgi:serine/threonine protein kinase
VISFECPACRRKLQVQDQFAGQKGKCPCGQVVDFPAAPEPAAAPPAPGNPEVTALLAPAQAADEIGRLGSYRVLKVLGVGGMGVVFQGEDPQLGRPVALKAMLPSLAANATAHRRFLREARAAAQVRHDHVVAVYQVGEERGAPFLAMEFLEGETLDDRLAREGRLPVAEVLRIGREVAEGLAAAHHKGLIHRDIKPGNIWLESSGEPGASATGGRVKILDFGLARVAGDDARLTRTGTVVGTPSYMAPEQAKGLAVDGRCDLFSLGVVLYQASTGELPFKGADTMSTLIALAREQPLPPCLVNLEVPGPLSDFIEHLLAKGPDDRPASARAAADALAALERAPDVSVVPPPVRAAPGAEARRGGCRRQAAAVLFVLAAAALGVWAAVRVGS